MTELITFLTWLLSLFAAAIMACQIAYASTLAQDIKAIFGLNAEADYSKYKWKWWATPFVFVFLELRALLDCPFCLSFWLGLTINLTLWDLTLLQSVVYALLCLPLVEVYRKLTL